MKRICFHLLTSLLFVCLLLGAGRSAVSAASEFELIENGSFESGLWRTDAGIGGVTVDQSVYHEGTASARADGSSKVHYVFSNDIAVDPSGHYTLSLWIKTDNVSKPTAASVNVLQLNRSKQAIHWYPSGDSKLIATGGTQDWTEYKIILDEIHSDAAFLRVYVRLDANVTGTVWFDDVSLELSMKLNQGVMGNIYREDEPISLGVVTSGDRLSWTVTNYWGDTVLQGSDPVQGGVYELPLPLQTQGYFELIVTAYKNDTLLDQYTTHLARLPSFDLTQVDDSPFGFAAHLARASRGWSPEVSTLIGHSGAKNMRDEIEWIRVEREKGVYTFPEVDERYMGMLAQIGIKPSLVLDFTNPFYDNNSTPYTDEGRQGFANYGKALLQHYGNQIEWLEVYNEFNIPEFGDRGDGPADSRADYYYPLLKKTYEELKSVRPDLTVVGMATSGVPLTWMEEVFQLGGMDYMDAISIHPYRFPRAPEGMAHDIANVQNLIRQYNNGQLKPIWVTEFGWPTNTGTTGVDNWTQAEYLVRGHVILLASGVEKIFWYDFMNDGRSASDSEENFGVIRNSTSRLGAHVPKPAFAAYGAMTRQLTGAQFIERETVAEQVHSYLFDRNNERFRVMWSLEPANVTLQAASAVTVTDIMGNVTSYEPAGGEVYLTLTGEPVYVSGGVGQVTAGTDIAVELEGDYAVVGEEGVLHLIVNNSQSSAINVTFEGLLGNSYEVSAEAGETVRQEVVLPGYDKEGTQTIRSAISVNGTPAGRLILQFPVIQPYSVKVSPYIVDISQHEVALQLEVNNYSRLNELVLNGVQWQVGEQTGTYSDPVNLPPSSGETIELAIPSVDYWMGYPVQVITDLEGFDPVIYDKETSFSPVIRHTPVVDGSADDMGSLPFIDLEAHGVARFSDEQSYHGPEDLSGQIWLNWDDQHLHLTAKVTDDVFAYPAAQDEIWKNDSIQFGVAEGMPGDTMLWYEYGLSMTPEGPQMFRWISPEDTTTGVIEDVELQITRNEDEKSTLYEAAIPWELFEPLDLSVNDLFSFSVLVNDNDDMGREGFIQWAGGIGSTKNPAAFRPVQLVSDAAAVAPPLISVEGLVPDGQYTDSVTPRVSAEDAAGGEVTIEVLLDEQPWENGTEITEKGNHTLKISAVNETGVSAAETIQFTLNHSTKLEIGDVTAAVYSDPVLLQATLMSKGDQPVEDAEISFEVNGTVVGTAMTDNTGTASLNYIPDAGVMAGGEVRAVYSPDAVRFLEGVEAAGTLLVQKEEASIRYTGSYLANVKERPLLSASVVQQEDGNPGIRQGLPVEFKVASFLPPGQGKTVTENVYATDSEGAVMSQVQLTGGLYKVTSKLLENDYYVSDETVTYLIVHPFSTGNRTGDRNEVDLEAGEFEWLVLEKDNGYWKGEAAVNGEVYTVWLADPETGDKAKPEAEPLTIWKGRDTAAPPVFSDPIRIYKFP